METQIKIKLKRIFLYIIVFLIMFYILIFFISNNKAEQESNETKDIVEQFILTEMKIENNPMKIKIIKQNEENKEPFIYFISDKSKIKEFKNFFNNILSENIKIDNEFNSICDITFYGDTDIIVSVSKDKMIRITIETINLKEYYKISENIFNEIIELVNVKYYLHKSDLTEPSSSICNKANNTILSGMPSSDIASLKEKIHNIHSSLEYHLVERVSIIKSANSIYWEPEIKNEIFIQPNGEKIQSSGFWEYRDSLQNINKLEINNQLKIIINDIISKLEYGMNNHDISECFEAHKILHDLDYWIVNYPKSSLEIAPVDWEGIYCYYGNIENYGL